MATLEAHVVLREQLVPELELQVLLVSQVATPTAAPAVMAEAQLLLAQPSMQPVVLVAQAEPRLTASVVLVAEAVLQLCLVRLELQPVVLVALVVLQQITSVALAALVVLQMSTSLVQLHEVVLAALVEHQRIALLVPVVLVVHQLLLALAQQRQRVVPAVEVATDTTLVPVVPEDPHLQHLVVHQLRLAVLVVLAEPWVLAQLPLVVPVELR